MKDSKSEKSAKKRFTLYIGNKNYSSWSLRPWLVLKYFGIEFDEVIIPLRQPDSKTKLLAVSPSGKVPILKHNDLLIWDSLAICEYLNDFFPGNRYWPLESEARAVARSVSAEMHSSFISLRKACPMDIRSKRTVELTDEVKADIQRIFKIWKDCRDRFGKNQGDFLFGEFTIADAMYAPVVYRFKTYGIPLEGEVKEYVECMLEIPAMKEWREAAAQETWTIVH